MNGVDFLFLNASNMPSRPVFPYAFVQVSEIARRYNLTVKRLDLLNSKNELWPLLIKELILCYQPRMIGVTLRQADSLSYKDYFDPIAGKKCGTYYPVNDSLMLIQIIRECTKSPIVMGGIGYTVHSKKHFEFFNLDYGIQGDPDSFFENFENAIHGRKLENILGLIYKFEGETRVNKRGYFSPSPNTEYTEEILHEMVEFYGHNVFWGSNPPTVAVEIMRGCPFKCYFCTEPYVKGKNIRYRDISVIEKELQFLLKNNIRRFWFVCSELNGAGMKFAKKIAELVKSLNKKYPGPLIEWSAYSLPNMTFDELKYLYGSGYAGALNDVLSLDDENLRAAGIPYRSKQAVVFLRALHKLNNDKDESKVKSNYESDNAQIERIATQTPKDLGNMLSLFLGNVYANENTIKNSLKIIDDSNLNNCYDRGHIISSTRVFDIDGKIHAERDGQMITYEKNSDDENGKNINILFPTFHLSQYLLDYLNTSYEIDVFFNFIADTFLSNAHKQKKNWNQFLRQHTSVSEFSKFLKVFKIKQFSNGSKKEFLQLFNSTNSDNETSNINTKLCLDKLFTNPKNIYIEILDLLKITYDKNGKVVDSSYKIHNQLYSKYKDNAHLLNDVCFRLSIKKNTLELLCMKWFIYKHNIIIRPDYKKLLFSNCLES